MNFKLQSPIFSKIRREPGLPPTDLSGEASAKVEIPATAKADHRFQASFPSLPLSSPSAPLHRRAQSPSAKNKFLSVKPSIFIRFAAVASSLMLSASPLHSQVEDATFIGFIYFPHLITPEQYSAGFSQYSSVWELADRYHGGNFQVGLPHNWAVVQKPPGYPTDNTYSTIEGGLGFWTDIRNATITPKFKMGGVARGFSSIADGPGWGTRDWDDPLTGRVAIAQLSNRLLMPQDGLPLARETHGEFFGYGYMDLPFVDASPTTFGADVPTGDNCWTLFINSANFKGPAAFFLPHFFASPAIDDPSVEGIFFDTLDMNPRRSHAMEIQHIPAAIASDPSGTQYAKIANIQFPNNGDDTTITLQTVKSYQKGALWNDVNAWFNGGATSTGVFKEAFEYEHLTDFGFAPVLNNSITIGKSSDPRDTHPRLKLRQMVLGLDLHPTTFRYDWTSPFVRKEGNYFILPNYYRLDNVEGTLEWTAIGESQVPDSTGLISHQFPVGNRDTTPRTTPYTSNPDWTNPGPAAGPFTTLLGDNSTVTYYWYRFIDQPAIMNANYSDLQRQKLQERVELIHRNWPITRDYMSPPTFGDLASIDSGSVVTPPPGLEIGYVPIATEQVPNLDYIAWTESFLDPNLNNPTGDSDGDGQSNYFEYLFGLDPQNGASLEAISKLPTNSLQYTYQRRQTTLSGQTYTVLLSPNLRSDSWHTNTDISQTVTATHQDGTEDVLISIDPEGLDDHLFLRIQVN